MRVPITRKLADGTITDGTAERTVVDGRLAWCDFRDLDGNELILPPGAEFRVVVE